MSIFSVVKEAPPIEVFHLVKVFNEDDNPSKVNLTIGGMYILITVCYQLILTIVFNFTAYRTDEGKPFYMPVVKKAESVVLENTLNHEYLPILGLESFTKAASQLLLGNIAERQEEGTVIIYIYTILF
jgi:aspartate aminotransferase